MKLRYECQVAISVRAVQGISHRKKLSSPISALIANMVMEDVEQWTLAS